MFVGSINSTVRKFMAHHVDVFEGVPAIVGCSGNFTFEAILSQHAKPAAIHSNDVALYTTLAGRWLLGQKVDVSINEDAYDWLTPFLDTDTRRLATIMVLLDMLKYEKRNNAHAVRMWSNYMIELDRLVTQTATDLEATRDEIKIASYFAGDVFDHYQRYGDDPNAIFCCFAPTYSGGYERMYKRLDEILHWDRPTYPMLTEERRNELLRWMADRRYLWYDDRVIDWLKPVMEQRSGRMHTVYLYSNIIHEPAVFLDMGTTKLPNWPLADEHLEITPDSHLQLYQISTSDLGLYKDAFLGKNIDHAAGNWAFAVAIDGKIVGFMEFTRPNFGPIDEVYMMADFAVPTTRYKRLSRLIVMLAVSAQTGATITRLRQIRTRAVITTAFTDKPVSMKYRGVLELLKRGQTKEGQKFLNYGAPFTSLSWQDTLRTWLTKHGSTSS